MLPGSGGYSLQRNETKSRESRQKQASALATHLFQNFSILKAGSEHLRSCEEPWKEVELGDNPGFRFHSLHDTKSAPGLYGAHSAFDGLGNLLLSASFFECSRKGFFHGLLRYNEDPI